MLFNIKRGIVIFINVKEGRKNTLLDQKIEILADILKDYRVSELRNPKKENITLWLSQFSPQNQEIILDEMINICNKLYLTEMEVDNFLKGLVSNEKLTNSDSKSFWSNVSLLNIQQNGHSQSIMVSKFQKIIFDETGITVAINDNTKSNFIYVDDFLFTGNRLYQDISNYFHTEATGKIDIIYIGYFKQGQYYNGNRLKANFKNINIQFWRMFELENNTNCQNQSHILWPIENIKGNIEVVSFLKHYGDKDHTIYRNLDQPKGPYCESDNLFSSEYNRQILEKEFTLAGLKIINKIGIGYWKPLGFSPFNNLGFGAMVFSYRNCPNNTPLCLWWGDWNGNSIWYPLFQRETYK